MEAVFLKLVNMSITASYLVVAVILFRLLFRNAPKSIRVALWALVGIRLVFPFSIESMLSLIPSSEPLPREFLYAATPQINTGIPAVNNSLNPIIAQSLTPNELASANPTQILSFVFACIWLMGVAAMVIYALVSYLIVRRKVGASIPLGKNLRLCDSIDTPFILGIIRPKIYLPSSLDEATAAHVIAHEKAHLQRKDHWWKPLGFALLTVYWFNPVLWIAYILLCRDIELACDEKVVRELDTVQKKAYSAALLNCSVPRHMIAACPLAFGEVDVKSRIKSVLNYKKPAFWIVLTAVIVSIAVGVCFMTDPRVDDQAEFIDAVPIINDITSGNGYKILKQSTKSINITIPKSALPDSIYSKDGHTFDVNDIVVYETDTTRFYLDSIRFANEGEDWLYFKFNADYTFPEAGTVMLLHSAKDKDITQQQLWVSHKSIMDRGKEYPYAVSFRGVDGSTSFTVYVNTEVCKAVSENLKFRVDNFTELTYCPEGYDPVDAALLVEKQLPSGSYVCSECVYWPPYSSALRPDYGPYNFLVNKDSISYYSASNGDVLEEHTVDWKWQPLAQCYEDAFFYIQWYEEFASILNTDAPAPGEATLYQILDKGHMLVKSDGIVYMVDGTHLGRKAPLEYVDAIYRVGRVELTSGEDSSVDTDVPVTYPDSMKENEISNRYSTISGQIFDSRSAQDMLIQNAILTGLNVHNTGDVFYAESHQVLSEMLGCGAEAEEGAPVGFTVVDVMAVVMKAHRQDSGIVPFFEADYEYVNATITIERYADGTMKLSEYQENEIGDLSDYDLTPLKQHCFDQAVRYWGMDTELMVEDLLDTISSSPAQYSNAQPYIDAHAEEYEKLIHLGEHTLVSCFDAFLNKRASGIRAEIMAAACRDIGKAMGEDIGFDGQYINGPTWFDVFHAEALKLYENSSMEDLQQTNRASWVLLKMLEQTPEPISIDVIPTAP